MLVMVITILYDAVLVLTRYTQDRLIDTPLAYTWTVFDKKVDIGVHATAAHEALEGGLFPALQLQPDVP